MKTHFKFTLPTVSALICPQSKKRLYCYDVQLPGLELQVTPSQLKTYYIQLRIKGKPTRIKIGSAAYLSPDQARELARDKTYLAAKGESLSSLRGRPEPTPHSSTYTLSYWWQTYRADLITRSASPKTLSYFDYLYTKHIGPVLGDFELSRIALDELNSLRQGVAMGTKTGAYTTSNRVIGLVRNIYSHASKLGGWVGDPPTKRVAKYKEGRRERYIQEGEMSRFLKSAWELSLIGDVFADAILLALYTGARKSCIFNATWDQFDLTQEVAIWTIPSSAIGNKLKRTVRVALCQSARDILEARRVGPRHSAVAKYVFLSPKGDMPIVTPQKAFNRLEEKTSVPDITMHVLRHTFITYGKWSGIGDDQLRRIAGHADGSDSHTRYIHYPDDVLFELASKVEEQMHRRGKFTRSLVVNAQK